MRLQHRQCFGLLAVAAICGTSAPALASMPRHFGGAVYALSNDASGNSLLVYRRAPSGELSFAGDVATGGMGSGAGLGSQGALAFSSNHRFLYAVNAGSHSVSVFYIGRGMPRLVQVIPAGGDTPISIAASGPWVYVLNADGAGGGADNVSQFFSIFGGLVIPAPIQTRGLSTDNAGPAQVAVSPNGRTVVVTEKATNKIDTFNVGFFGALSNANVQDSAGATPFGFDFSTQGYLIVSEAFGGGTDASAVSSYRVGLFGALNTVSASVPTTETAACWVATTANGRYAYCTNTGSNSVTGYEVNLATGQLSILDADGVTGQTAAGPLDAATVGNRFLYVLDPSGGEIQGFTIDHDGSLSPVNSLMGIPSSAAGLIAE